MALRYGAAGAETLTGLGEFNATVIDTDPVLGPVGTRGGLFGLGGADLILGAMFPDHLSGGDGNDSLAAGDGDDARTYRSEEQDFAGLQEREVLGGLQGGGGDDTLDGGAGRDRLSGGAGNDVLIGGEGHDSPGFTHTAVEESWFSSSSSTTTSAGLSGGRGDDLLLGGAGNDLLHGGADADTLAGGAGADTLEGTSGRDVFVFDTALDATTNLDRVRGFSLADDLILLDARSFLGLDPGVLAAEAFRSLAGPLVATAETDRILYDRATGTLAFDADGSGEAFAAVAFAILENRPAALGSEAILIG